MTKEASKIVVRQLIDTKQLKQDLSYSLANLSDAMVQQAALFAHYGVIAAQASRQVDNIKLMVDNIEAAVYRKVRDELIANGEKVTEGLLEKIVRRHDRMIQASRALNEAKQIESVAKTAVEAFRHRRDMLIQQGLISREEMKGELSIQARQHNEASIEDVKQRYLNRIKNKSEEAA